MKVLVLGVLAVHVIGSYSLIIPDELPSILSVIYSNIPTIKKGTDSRIGWGFRLGDRADFQVLVELGPQTNTQQLANQGDTNRKRSSLHNLANTLYAQRQKDKRIREEEEKRVREEENQTTGDGEEEKDGSSNDGAQWLKTWSKSVNKKEKNEPLPLRPKPGLGIGEIDAKSVIPEDSVLLAQELKKSEKVKVDVVPEPPAYSAPQEGLALTGTDAKPVADKDSVLVAQEIRKLLEKLKKSASTENPTTSTFQESASEKADLE